MDINRLISLIVIFAVAANIVVSVWGYQDALRHTTVLDARMVNVETRQDRLSQAYLRNDAAIDALKESTSLLEGRLIAISPDDARRSAEVLKRLEQGRK